MRLSSETKNFLIINYLAKCKYDGFCLFNNLNKDDAVSITGEEFNNLMNRVAIMFAKIKKERINMEKTRSILLPCPFCGKHEIDERLVSVDKSYHKTPYENRMVCRWCDAVGPIPSSVDWNTRKEKE